jgi:hypothetical protein
MWFLHQQELLLLVRLLRQLLQLPIPTLPWLPKRRVVYGQLHHCRLILVAFFSPKF